MIPEKRHTVGGVDVGPRTERDKLSFDAKQMPLMGEVGDPQARRDFDYYPTPAWMTAALCRRAAVRRVLEPCVGAGAISTALQALDVEIVGTNDLDPSRAADWHMDATQRPTWLEFARILDPAWVVTNPPFNLADAIVPLAVSQGYSVAMLLRLTWLEPTEARATFLRVSPPSQLIVLPRHDFRGNGSTDSVTSAWFVWDDQSSGIEVVTKAERDELIATSDRDTAP